MTKKEFVKKLTEKGELGSQKIGLEQTNLFLETLTDILSTGEDVRFIGWGTFEIIERKKRKGRNPKTGEKISIPSKKIVKFKLGKKLKESVNIKPKKKAKNKKKK